MPVVLGIDAAWTPTNPTGVALVARRGHGWHLIAVESSYRSFLARTDPSITIEKRPSGSLPDPRALLASAEMLGNAQIDLVAVDMPLARSPIEKRRFSDDEVSRAYGCRKCGTHSPGKTRPGDISTKLNEGFAAAGYPLRTKSATVPGLIEVYPHPALVELASAPERLKYKASKVASYWPEHLSAQRRQCLYRVWSDIVRLLEREIAGVTSALACPAANATRVELKAYEDMLDAVVCAWVGICALEGCAFPYGDDDSAIWIPLARQVCNVRS